MHFARLLLVLCVSMLVAASAAAGATERRSPQAAEGFIVVYRASVVDAKAKTAKLERAHGFAAKHRYSHAVEGFSARLTAGQLRALRADPAVAYVVRDRVVHALDSAPVASGDSVPTGVRRIEAGTSSTVRDAARVNVAVIDTGIDLSHPDLNAVHGTNCVAPATAASDDNGHGTHVAGSIAAENDGAGVTGIAPGTRVYAAKVLDGAGNGTWSQIICGIDWVTSTRMDADPANDIAVANVSLGGPGQPVAPCSTTTDPLHKAICASTATGVTYVVAAGNDGWDFDYASVPDVPAAYPEVLTVTAATDSDGLAGGSGGAPACATYERDDYYASFSNFAATSAGAAHTVAAPGTCITSTWPGGGYDTISGTSMATPHVAGLVALCLDGPCAGLAPRDVIQSMRRDAQARTAETPGYGFAGDPTRPAGGRYYGYLAWAPPAIDEPIAEPTPTAPADMTAPTVSSVAPSGGATVVELVATVGVAFSEPMDAAATQAAFSLVRASNGAPVGGAFSWSGTTMTFDPTGDLAPSTTYRARVSTAATDAAGNALATEIAWSFTTTSVTTTLVPSGVVREAGSLRSGDAARLRADDGSYYEVNSTTSSTRMTSWYAKFAGVSNALVGLKASYSGKNSRSCNQTVSIWRWTTSSWVVLDSRSVGTTEVGLTVVPGGSLADYVSGSSGDGEVRVRVRCTTTSGSFYASGDLLTLTVTR